jgi:hypothetical protein
MIIITGSSSINIISSVIIISFSSSSGSNIGGSTCIS